MTKLKPIARYALLAAATVLGWLVIAANGASWGLARLQAAAQIRAELLPNALAKEPASAGPA